MGRTTAQVSACKEARKIEKNSSSFSDQKNARHKGQIKEKGKLL